MEFHRDVKITHKPYYDNSLGGYRKVAHLRLIWTERDSPFPVSGQRHLNG